MYLYTSDQLTPDHYGDMSVNTRSLAYALMLLKDMVGALPYELEAGGDAIAGLVSAKTYSMLHMLDVASEAVEDLEVFFMQQAHADARAEPAA